MHGSAEQLRQLIVQRDRLVEVMGRIVAAWQLASSLGDCEASSLTSVHNHITDARALLDEIKG